MDSTTTQLWDSKARHAWNNEDPPSSQPRSWEIDLDTRGHLTRSRERLRLTRGTLLPLDPTRRTTPVYTRPAIVSPPVAPVVAISGHLPRPSIHPTSLSGVFPLSLSSSTILPFFLFALPPSRSPQRPELTAKAASDTE